MADRETGTVKEWNEKGFGFIERHGTGDRIFVHASDTADRQALVPGSKVSFIYESDEKVGKARKVDIEEMGEHAVLDEGPRETGTVIRWNGEKGFGFIGRANGEADAFFHKKSFGGYNEPFVGQVVSFIFEEGPKGAAATQVKEEEGGIAVDEALVEDEGEREMGTVKRWNAEKGFGFIGRVRGKEDAFFHKKSFTGSDEPYVGQAVSFVFEEGPKGAAAIKVIGGKSVVIEEEEEEEEEGVARVTAKVRYGKAVNYNDPPPLNPDSGYGFVVELDQLTAKKPKKHYFHMSEIETPDENGGIDVDTVVSFIIIPATKGTQAASVTITDSSK